MYHLGNPCIHCKQPHDDVAPGFCAAAKGFAARIRCVEFCKGLLNKLNEDFTRESLRLKTMIADQETILAQAESGLDTDKIELAETFLQVSDFSSGGEDRFAAKKDATDWFALGQKGRTNLRREYIGTKSYDRWHGQRSDHEYGMGPRHGRIIFSIGLAPEFRDHEFTEQECEAAVYYLLRLERVQKARIAV